MIVGSRPSSPADEASDGGLHAPAAFPVSGGKTGSCPMGSPTRGGESVRSAAMDRLEAVRYTRCLALLGILDQPSVLTAPGTVTHPHPEIDWVSDNQVKGISEIRIF